MSGAALAEVPERVAAVHEALERGEVARAEACLAELQTLLRALRAHGACCAPGEAESWRASLLACLENAQGRWRGLAEQLQQAGSARTALGRYAR